MYYFHGAINANTFQPHGVKTRKLDAHYNKNRITYNNSRVHASSANYKVKFVRLSMTYYSNKINPGHIMIQCVNMSMHYYIFKTACLLLFMQVLFFSPPVKCKFYQEQEMHRPTSADVYPLDCKTIMCLHTHQCTIHTHAAPSAELVSSIKLSWGQSLRKLHDA